MLSTLLGSFVPVYADVQKGDFKDKQEGGGKDGGDGESKDEGEGEQDKAEGQEAGQEEEEAEDVSHLSYVVRLGAHRQIMFKLSCRSSPLLVFRPTHIWSLR